MDLLQAMLDRSVRIVTFGYDRIMHFCVICGVEWPNTGPTLQDIDKQMQPPAIAGWWEAGQPDNHKSDCPVKIAMLQGYKVLPYLPPPPPLRETSVVSGSIHAP